MNVKQVIEQLQTLPKDANVFYVWDSEPRSEVEEIYVAQSGKVILKTEDDVVYNENEKPTSVLSGSQETKDQNRQK